MPRKPKIVGYTIGELLGEPAALCVKCNRADGTPGRLPIYEHQEWRTGLAELLCEECGARIDVEVAPRRPESGNDR